jgi:hypothetical protein
MMAVIAFLRDALDWYDSGRLALLSGAQFWLALGPNSYYGTESFLTENIPTLWDPILVFLLNLPAFIVAAVLGLLFWFASRRPRAKPKSRPLNSRS